jgi:peptidoglycan-associated lipoprotein
MGGRCASAVLGSFLVAVVGFGCAAQSGSTPASTASTDGGESGNGGGRAALVPVSQTERHSTMASTSLMSARPSLQDFVAVADLRDVHFDFDRYDIRPADAGILDTTAAWLKTHPDHTLLVEGHADERGTNEYNLSLGERRAKASMNYLASHGVPATRITLISYGEEKNVCGEKSESCWSRNRRAHFMVKAR